MSRLSQGPKKSKLLPRVLIMGAVGLGVLAVSHLRTQPVVSVVDPIAYQATVAAPSEQPIAEDIEYRVPAEHPRRISIPSILVSGYVQQVGTDAHGRVGVPNNIHLAGWFNHYARPGDKGLSIITGHYGGRSASGIFSNLTKVQIGEKFTVEMGDLSTRTFVVRDVVTLDMEDATLVFEQKYDRQLNLITCTGDYLPNARTYDQRTIVMAELVQP